LHECTKRVFRFAEEEYWAQCGLTKGEEDPKRFAKRDKKKGRKKGKKRKKSCEEKKNAVKAEEREE